MQRLQWIQRLQAIAQTGLTYARDPYDLERYRELRALAVEMLAAEGGVPEEPLRLVFAAEDGYPTPKVDVRAVVFREGKVLLTKERADGRWTLPGGWADVGSSPSEMAARETLEETGYLVRPVKLLAVLDKAKHAHPPQPSYVYKLFIHCELEGGAPRETLETEGCDYFARDALPPLSLDRVTEPQLLRMFAHLDDPERPTDFD
ncbi:NUDIX hydrolase [Cystobacter fuscus]|uniref:NUDIX hydrolase n=1 Tax=Cystobacter fuscus TaxID=43 RepID=UPI002B2C0C23|nr:NUDIX hydrolase [Cystobacter fuscus]